MVLDISDLDGIPEILLQTPTVLLRIKYYDWT